MRITVQHRPLGDEHPYKVSADQRDPRHPIAGEPVTVHAVTCPTTEETSVWVSVTAPQAEGSRQVQCERVGPAESEITGPGGGIVKSEATEWRASLGPFEPGQIVYTVSARQEEDIVTAGPFAVEIRERFALDRVRSVGRWSKSILIEYEPAGPSARTYGQLLQLADDTTLALRVGETARLRPEDAVAPTGMAPGGWTQVRLGDYLIAISASGATLTVRSSDGEILLRESAPLGIVEIPGSPVFDLTRSLESPTEERFFGLGERFHAFNQRGFRVDTHVYEQYGDQGFRTYFPVPFLVSSRGYGLWVETSRRTVFDLAASFADRLEVRSSDDVVALRFFPGNPCEVVRSFTARTGRSSVPPEWVFGPWMSGNEWNSEERLLREIRTTIDLDIPASVVVVEAWSDEQTFYVWNETGVKPKAPDEPIRYDDLILKRDGKWPDPRGMIERIHDLGLRIVLWQIPVIKRLEGDHRLHQLDEAYVEEHHLCVADSDGSPYRIRPGWFHHGMVVDFTRPEARDWWFAKRRYLIEECGVDGFKTDGGEQVWGEQTLFANESRGDEMINRYPVEYLHAYHAAITDAGSIPVTFSRSGYTGAQRYAVHWAGDQRSTWGEFRAVYRAALNAGLSGIAIIGWDLAGFAGEIPTAELYKRSAACSAMSPIMQYHSDFNHHRLPSNDRTPWNIADRQADPTVLSTYRKYAHLRMRLIPYLHAEAANSAATGDPMMAPLFYRHPDAPDIWDVCDQHYLGRALLVAPILEEGITERTVYLPAGEWIYVWTDETLAGPAKRTVRADYETIPVFLNRDAPWPFDGTEPFRNLPSTGGSQSAR